MNVELRKLRILAPAVLLAASTGLSTAVLAPAPAVAAGGTIEGKVVFEGQPRRNPLIRMGADPNCLTINAGKKVVQEYVALNAERAVGNVFVHVAGDVPYSGGAPSEPVVVEQEGCIYHPRISGGMVGQTLKVKNNDATLHNIHSMSEEGNSFNVGQPKAGLEFDYKLKDDEVMLRLKCDVHPWMVGFIGVKSHPYFAVSAEDGTFRIEGVPPGTYTLQAWQEVLGTVEHEVEVKEGETVSVDFAYGGKDSATLTPAPKVRDVAVGR